MKSDKTAYDTTRQLLPLAQRSLEGMRAEVVRSDPAGRFEVISILFIEISEAYSNTVSNAA
ncbi:hypothetical protein KIN20_010410 [Parelaphostrongylus tenuis]|uniref:Uncharacterized protein n=1 Tax=Parelaphostrongylus tenuis TaxID=148309 RepID=A0AAD5M7U7_PARTN|nr:hypothetical protein KIN20_010410 [Parelaphostrongylus tenuis]